MDENLNLVGNTEIEKALKEFESKSQLEQAQAPLLASNGAKTSEIPKIVQLTMKWFGVKEQKQAEYILFGFVLIVIGFSIFLVFGGAKSSTPLFLPTPFQENNL